MPINILTALKQKPEPLNFILPGLVAGTVGAIVSPGGSGKSAFALQLCAQIAGGPNLLGIETVQAQAAYMPGEDPELAVQHRLYALGEHCEDRHIEQLSKNLFIEPLESFSVNIMTEQWFNYFMQIAENRSLLIIDTLRIIHELDENDSSAMTQIIGKMKIIAAKTKCAIVFLHHTSKNSAMNDTGAEQQASRGSSVLVDNIRWQGYLKTMSSAEAKKLGVAENQRKFFVEFGVSKQNFGAPFEPYFLRKISCKDGEIAGGYTLQKAHLTKNNNKKESKNEFAN